MSVPELTRRGYPESLILGTLAGSATLGLLIPPSIILIVYGAFGNVSIGALFLGGVIMLVLSNVERSVQDQRREVPLQVYLRDEIGAVEQERARGQALGERSAGG